MDGQHDHMKFSELTFQAIVESTPNAIVLVNKEGKIAYVNNQTEKLFGYKRAELVGQMVEELIPERYKKNHSGYRNAFFDAPSVRAMGAGRELFAKRKDASEFPIEIGLNPVVTVDGTLVLASIIDITERKKAEERFKLVVESAPNAMVLVNEKGDISLVNNQAERLFGFSRNELIGNKLEMLIPDRFKQNHPNHRGAFFAHPTTRAMGGGRDLFAMRKDGSEIQVEIGLNPIETNDGHMVLASIIDITERKAQELIIKQQVSELEIKNKELEQFTYIASHDLQEPLRTISNFIQIIQEDYDDAFDKQAKEYLSTIDFSAKRMRSLVRALLDYSRLGRDRKIEQLDCKQLFDEVLSDLDTLISSNKAKVKWVGEFPIIYGYATELRQLFQNLISNSIKFGRNGHPVHVEVDAVKLNQQWQFSIKDNGIGIDPKDFDRIFNIFQRLEVTKEHEGYGIGLANCKKIVELHKGKIWIESEVGKGSTFNFTITNQRL